MLYLIFCIIILALVFDFLNGFHDAANSIATVVSTRVLSPSQAVIWAAFFNFVAAFTFGTGVAKAIAGDYLKADPALGYVDVYVVMGGLIGAIFWNILTWLLALPTSSSHALVSGLAGAAVAKSGFAVMNWTGWVPLLVFIVLSPLVGFLLGAFNMIAVAWIFRRSHPHKVDLLFRRLQLISAGVFSLGHGGNDAQKTMGIIVMLLVAAGHGPGTPKATGPIGDRSIFPGSSTSTACQLSWPVTPPSPWARCSAAGASSRRLAPASPGCSRSAGSVPSWPPPRPSSASPTFTSPSPPPTPSPDRFSASGPPAACARSAGFGGSESSWPGCSTIPCAAFVSAITYFLIHMLIRPFFGG